MSSQDKLRQELQELSPAQLRELLSVSGHGQLLRREEEKESGPSAVDQQLVTAAKDEGNAFFRLGRMEDAVSAYSRCIEMDPNNAVCLSNRAAAYLKLKQFDLAIVDCTKAIEANPTIKVSVIYILSCCFLPDVVFKPLMRRATASIALQQYGQAVTDLVAAMAFEPRNKECRAKLRVIVDTATDVKQRENGADVELRKAGVHAASILSVCDGWVKSAVRGNPGPAAVNGHTLFRGDNDRIYLFGGRAVREQKPDVFVLDENDDSSWDRVLTRGADTPSSRAWHSTSAIGGKERDIQCMYGGVSSRGEDSSVYLLVPASSRGYQWVQPRCLQDPKQVPVPRSGHAMVSVVEDNGDRAVFLFGGRTKRGVNDQLLVLRHPPRLILFGGNGQLNDDRMNDVWLFDLEKQLWTLLQCCGDIPLPRSYHTAHTIGEFLFVIGGRTAEAEDDSMYMLDIGTAEWFKLPIPIDHGLTPRAWHSSVLTKSGKLFVLGGGTYHGPLKDAATLDLSYFQTKASLLNHIAIE
ncbi:Serine/threonine-protein phosphatase [Phytophthora palmivora]|uniref:Serine/threonine-protein phosphatase n=1 Tax=Phytophthora palmivora TaxID=4796 RepID=A0A2P4XSF4_9STRA|nr:Serine/threonine-protein phosphatase [Phytophthora palmivora]